MLRRIILALVLSALASVQGVAWAGAANVTLDGKFVLIAADGPEGETLQEYLQVGSTHYRLDSNGSLPFATGQPVEVTGTRDGDRVDVVTSRPTGAAPMVRTTGPISILAILVYWSVPPDDVTPSQAVTQIGTTDNAWYQEVSYGQTSLTATSTPWLQIAPPLNCTYDLAQTAEGAATSAGYDLSAFDRRLFYFPDGGCTDKGRGGWAEIGGPRIWIHGVMATRATVHEVGHTYGLWHANSLTCTDEVGDFVPLSTTCTTTEYGDPFDAMGQEAMGQVHFNASMKDYLGWMGGREETVSGPASFTLRPIEEGQAGLQGVKLIDGAETFWLEFRQPIGVDAYVLSSYPGSTDGILIHRREANPAWSDILDMRPGGDNRDAALPAGATWVDPLGDVTISVGEVSPSGAQVTVDYTAPPTVSAPVSSFVWNQQLSQGPQVTVQSKVTWSSTGGSAVCSYQAQMKVNGGSFADLALASPTATKATTAVAVGNAYRFRVRAIGCHGGVGPWAKGAAFTVHGFQQGAATYGTGWSSGALSGSWGGTVRYTTRAGKSATFTFTGQAIAWVGTRGPVYGSADVYIDDVLYRTVHANASVTKSSYVVAANNWAGTSGTHTIKVVNRATSGHPRIDVDGFIVLS